MVNQATTPGVAASCQKRDKVRRRRRRRREQRTRTHKNPKIMGLYTRGTFKLSFSTIMSIQYFNQSITRTASI